ncbi:MAG: bifunctional precorrin-2 dehydrogenase/sirohydrochlorin ferrochelatase [Chloroflexi bacterium]|nr:bifunctional precorrin-2 dehydrogenase/sirohydrochlorin ferrochelatase [Chloroflexota bacterium]
MPVYYPAFLDLAGKKAVVVGGGQVAERKALALLACGAQVTVVSPVLSPRLAVLAQRGAVTALRRAYQQGDVTGAFLVVASTDDRAVNQQASRDARAAGALVNTVDSAQESDFIVPSVVERGDLTVAISTNSRSPALARRLREELERYLTPDYGDLLRVAHQVEEELALRGVQCSPEAWQEHLGREFRELVRRRKLHQAKERLLQALLGTAERS